MKAFWDKHDKTARKGRITQAAALIFSNYPNMASGNAVAWAMQIERLVSEAIDQEEEKDV